MGDFIKQHWQYFLGALLLHVLFAGIFGLTMLNMQRNAPPVQLAIQAVLVDPAALNQPSRQQQRRERERVQQQQREAQAQREREQAAEQQRREQEEAARKQKEETARRDAEQQAEQARQLELKQRQEAEQRRLVEEKQLRERQEAEKKRAAAEAERKRQAEEEAKRVAEIQRRQKEEAERRRAAEEARRQQAAESELARQLQEEEANAAALSSPEAAQYVAMVKQAVERRWKRPLSARDDLVCELMVRQTPTGVVLSVKIGSCNGDPAVRQSLETAVYSASPLPTPSNPRLFQANLPFIFRPGGP